MTSAGTENSLKMKCFSLGNDCWVNFYAPKQ